MDEMIFWATWAIVLMVQNFSFTFVSRARNSGSLKRHLIAALASNGVWFIGAALVFSKLYDYMTGKSGLLAAILTGLFYTIFTCAGSILAHYWSLKTERGKTAVGANDRYAQIPVEQWEAIVRHFKLITSEGISRK